VDEKKKTGHQLNYLRMGKKEILMTQQVHIITKSFGTKKSTLAWNTKGELPLRKTG